jgi:adenosylhomocysteine/aminodeoxyfutalosine nucleosidase
MSQQKKFRSGVFFWITRLITLCLGVASWTQVARAEDIALFYALDQDLEKLGANQMPANVLKRGSRTIHRFVLPPHTVYAVKMGAGCVETAITAESLFQTVQVDRAFSIGPAGSLSDSIRPGDLYWISFVIPYQMGTATESGFVPSEGVPLELPEATKPRQKIPAVQLASGEVFIASGRERIRIQEMTSAQLIDMNLAGLVFSTKNHGLPLTALRLVSDSADQNAGEDFRKFDKSYGGEGIELFISWLESLPENKKSIDQHPNLRKLLEEGKDLEVETP